MRWMILCGLLLLPSLVGAAPCVFRWYPVDKYTEDSCNPATHPTGCKVQGKVQYRIWHQGPEDPVPQEVANTDATRIQVKVCRTGDYFLTAYQVDPNVDESDLSEPLTRVQLKPPQERK